MKLITLNKDELGKRSQDLASLIFEDGNHIDIIIGVATGGVYVSRPIKEKLTEKGWNGKYYEIKLSRSSTDIKKKLNLKTMLTKLPYSALNILRKLEVWTFENFKAKLYDTSKEKKVVLSDNLIGDIKNSKSVLLIDDAIDTGSTILAIKTVIKRINPNIDVKVAVLTVTHKKPYIQPDYTLYKQVLIRCPWAEDYKGKDKI